MSPEAQRIAIAEACGWTKIKANSFLNGVPDGWHGTPPGYGQTDVLRTVPDYLGDRNAMHEAKQMLNSVEEYAFTAALEDILKSSWHWKATAAQEAKAFLIAKNLWKEAADV